MSSHKERESALTGDVISEVLDGFQNIASSTRRQPGDPHYDRMYYKGWDDCLELVRSHLDLAVRQASDA